MYDVHVGVTAERGPVEQVPRVVQDRFGQREHGWSRDRAQVEFGPCRRHFFLAVASYNGPHLDTQGCKIGHQLGRIPAHTAGRRPQELLNVDCDSQGCSSGELRSFSMTKMASSMTKMASPMTKMASPMTKMASPMTNAAPQ